MLPAFGVFSEILPVFARKPIFGYKAIAAATAGIAFLGMLVWAHHMFATPMSTVVLAFFMLSSFIIAVPTGVKIFNWIATLWRGTVEWTTPLLYCVGGIATFTMGGITGIFLAVFPIDWQLTDTYFVVAHFHYTAFGASAFAMFAALYYWFPKMSGRMLSETLGKLGFGLMFVGFHLTFLIQHSAGLSGMPRRIYEYSDSRWTVYNFISTVGSFMIAWRRVDRGRRRLRAQAGPDRRPRPVEGEHARVVHALAAAGEQLRRRPARALGGADEGHPPRDRAADGRRPALPRRAAVMQAVSWKRRTQPSPVPGVKQVIADYVTLTKPKVQPLLLLTTVTTMYVAGDPSLRSCGSPSSAASCPRAARPPQPLLRPRHRRRDGPHGDRPVPAGRIPPRAALLYVSRCRPASFVVLAMTVEPARRLALALGFVWYTLVYTIWLKRRSPQNIVIGGAAGAVPPLVGWAAATGCSRPPRCTCSRSSSTGRRRTSGRSRC